MTGYVDEREQPTADDGVPELLQAARAGDAAARERLVEANLPLVRHVARRFAGSGYEIEDLQQLGALGLLKAIDRFDSSYGVRFSTYAVPLIIGEIRRHLRDDHPLKVSRSLKQLGRRVRETQERLTGELGRSPTVAEVAGALGIDGAELVEAVEAIRQPASLFEPVQDADAEGPSLIDRLPAPEGEGAWVESLSLEEALNRLEPRLRQLIRWRFFEEKTQQEIGDLLGVSQVQASRLEKRALRLLREELRAV